MNLIKQSTAVVISFGPFLDKTDGITLKTGLVSALDHASTGIMLTKNGGTLAVRHASVTASSYDAHGCYKVTLDTTDTNTLGSLRVIYTDATTCLPVWRDFMVAPANVYDSLIAGSSSLTVAADANVALIKAKTDNLPSDPADASDIASTLGTINTKLDTIDDFLDTEILAIKAKTDTIPASPASVSDIPSAAFITDFILQRNIAGGSDGVRTVTDALRVLRNKTTLTPLTPTTATLTVYAEDDTTPAWTGVVTLDGAALPITGVDPA